MHKKNNVGCLVTKSASDPLLEYSCNLGITTVDHVPAKKKSFTFSANGYLIEFSPNAILRH